MIEVKLVLYDAIELNMLAQVQQMIDIKRAQDHQRQFEQPPQGVGSEQPVEPVAASAAAEQTMAIDKTYTAAEAPAADVPAPGDASLHAVASVAQLAHPVPSDIEVARAITLYSQKEGVPKARELIESFGVKNAMSVPDERRAEFIAKTQA